jgi:adenine/guanine phosphoribosyltransferase-like PRPP-binding protein
VGGIRLKNYKFEKSKKKADDWFLALPNCEDYVPIFELALPDLPISGWVEQGEFGSCWTIVKGPTDEEISRLESLIDVMSRTLLVRRSGVLDGNFTDELTYCVALDFNFVDAKEHKYTKAGELERRAKYDSDRNSLAKLAKQVADAAIANPVLAMSDIVAAVPSSSPVAGTLAAAVADALKLPIIVVGKRTKESIKGLKFDRKIAVLNNAYLVDPVVKGKTILLVDDLFQSGASIWALARTAKAAGAVRVHGLVSVKSLRDTDNT